MKKFYLSTLGAMAFSAAFAQFPSNVDLPKTGATPPLTVVMPKSPLTSQIIFIGGVDTVATAATPTRPGPGGTIIYGKAAGKAMAKQWHDFTGFTPATAAEVTAWAAKGHQNFLGWVSVNHELIQKNDSIGDGGGNTVFAVKRGANDELVVVPQTLPDGRTGKFFAVDFVGTVGETGMNCGGITSNADGRIWTAEEWFQANNAAIFTAGNGVRDTTDFTISTTDFTTADYTGKVIKKVQNFNYMVEIDPRTAKAVRKQYNWGRQGFEGGVVLPDNKTVYLGEDATPGLFTKFLADVAGDFTKGQTFVYKHDLPGDKWVSIPNAVLDSMINIKAVAARKKVSMFNRLEWVAYNKLTGMVYIAETGSDNLNFRNQPGVLDDHWVTAYKNFYRQKNGVEFTLTDAAAKDSVREGKFTDYYGRVLEYNPTTQTMRTLIEGGPFFVTSPTAAAYPQKHFSNPDGLNIIYTNNKAYLTICEDLNGRTYGRVPSELVSDANNNICELFLLDLSIATPGVSDLVKISATPYGAEVTGACPTPDGKTLFVNAQHPATGNPFPYNNSLTYAIHGFDKAVITPTEKPAFEGASAFRIWPNPTSRELNFDNTTDVAIYNSKGARIRVYRDVKNIDISDLTSGVYYVSNKEGQIQKLVVE